MHTRRTTSCVLLACVLTALAAKDAESSRWVHDGHTMEPPDALRAFRRSFYECFHRRADALFELADAILCADGAAPSPAHLSLQASHRRRLGLPVDRTTQLRPRELDRPRRRRACPARPRRQRGGNRTGRGFAGPA